MPPIELDFHQKNVEETATSKRDDAILASHPVKDPRQSQATNSVFAVSREPISRTDETMA